MPVNVLYCEGGPKSPDTRLLASLLHGICTVEPSGGKYGFGQRIRLAREAKPGSIVGGLRDRDLEVEFTEPLHTPRPWRAGEGGRVWLGWYWERVEIENYLVDPAVVPRALGAQAPASAAYSAALSHAARAIAEYTAARTALTRSRLRFQPLPNRWGPERGREDHRFPGPCGEDECRDQLRRIVQEYEQTQEVSASAVLHRFDVLLSECRPGGPRFQHFLTFFAGKDLLFAMTDALVDFGQKSPLAFRERVLRGIQESPDDPWTWLPEWQQLRGTRWAGCCTRRALTPWQQHIVIVLCMCQSTVPRPVLVENRPALSCMQEIKIRFVE